MTCCASRVIDNNILSTIYNDHKFWFRNTVLDHPDLNHPLLLANLGYAGSGVSIWFRVPHVYMEQILNKLEIAIERISGNDWVEVDFYDLNKKHVKKVYARGFNENGIYFTDTDQLISWIKITNMVGVESKTTITSYNDMPLSAWQDDGTIP